MKLIIFFMTAFLMQVSASTHAQRITLEGKNIALKRVFQQIRQQTGHDILWQSGKVDDQAKVNVNFINEKVEIVLEQILSNIGLKYQISDNTIVIKQNNAKSTNIKTLDDIQEINVKGVVVNENNEPLAGASVRVKHEQRVALTDENGEFELDKVSESAVLIVSFIGYESKEVKVKESDLMVKLSLTNSEMEEVLINTGYQTIPAERATGSFGVVPMETVRAKLQTGIMSRIEGSVPGLFMKNGEINIRGISTLYGNQSPLYVVDGFPYEGNLNHINTEDIINITLMKDAAAASIYGTRAANGVIVITTRLGNSGEIRVNYNSSLFVSPLPDVGYYNFLNSREMVDLQEELFNMRHLDYSDYIKRSGQPKALEALYQHENGELTDTELNSILDRLRNLDNTSQIQKFLLQKYVKHQHSFSASGGNNIHRFNLSLNYIGNRPYNIKGYNENVNINFKDQISISRWLTADIGMVGNIGETKSAPVSATGYFRSRMPYEILKDEDGELVSWNHRKSQYEIDRLISVGLYDENYNPLRELDKIEGGNKSNYFRVQGGFNAKIIEGLSFDLKYQLEKGNNHNRTYYKKESYYVKNMVNDAAVIENGQVVENIPYGGQIYETRGDTRSYTARAQVNFDRFLTVQHRLTSVIGAERRSVARSSTTTHRMGYNDNNLQFIPINAVDLADIKGSQSINNSYSYKETSNNYFGAGEDRYISFYANVGHTYRNRYNFTGSVRIDDSNLFGTDPKYRYLPLWSLGASWRISEEQFMSSLKWLNNLNIRATYGLNGNIARTVGPYLQAQNSYNTESLAMATRIIYPPNKELRWERTAVANLGLDFSILQNRISTTVDLYSRKSTDLLGERETDPTNAFTTALINYGSLYNRGIEVGLNTINIRKQSFTWSSRFNFSYNKNKMTEISTKHETVLGYTSGGGVEKVGYPMKSIFNFRFAGLDPSNGTVLVYNKEGDIVQNYDSNNSYVQSITDVADLVYSGTLRPTYTLGFSNEFKYKNVILNIFIIGNGGDVMRDAVPAILSRSNITQNIDRRAANFWRKPGDEKISGIMPAPNLEGNSDAYFSVLWTAADVNTLKADYIKVRDVSISYDFTSAFNSNRYISSASLTFQVQNPFRWLRNDQGLDPEAYSASSIYSQRNSPVTPVYILGVSVNF